MLGKHIVIMEMAAVRPCIMILIPVGIIADQEGPQDLTGNFSSAVRNRGVTDGFSSET
jgi:hypothetical protein